MGLFSRKRRKQDRSAGVTSANPSPEPATQQEKTPPAPDPVRELARLESMRDRGMLTKEEFDREKRQLLASQTYRRI